MKPIVLALPALLALAACDGGTQSAGTSTEEAEAAGNIVGNSSSSKPSDEATPETPAEIPTAIQGRWGLVAADCEPGRADAKGLLTIGATSLEFYESVGTLSEITAANSREIRATFDFEGEGMTWQRDMTLRRVDPIVPPPFLIRQEHGANAAPEPFRYASCNQGS
jgi:hypothetical protein